MDILQLPEGESFVVGSRGNKPTLNHLIKVVDPVFIFCTNGNAKATVDLKEYTMEKNTLLFFLPGCIVSFFESSPDYACTYFICNDDILHEASFRFDHSFFAVLRENPIVRPANQYVFGIRSFFEYVDYLYKDKEHGFRMQVLKNALQCFLMDLCDKAHKGEISNNLWNANRKEVIFNRFMELVHNHYMEEREVAFYADKLCISPRYLSSVVRSVRIDVTPKAIIDSFVVLEIKALLQSTNLSIQEIADRLHFPDQSFFGRYFKKHTGLMPSRYRAENKWVEK